MPGTSSSRTVPEQEEPQPDPIQVLPPPEPTTISSSSSSEEEDSEETESDPDVPLAQKFLKRRKRTLLRTGSSRTVPLKEATTPSKVKAFTSSQPTPSVPSRNISSRTRSRTTFQTPKHLLKQKEPICLDEESSEEEEEKAEEKEPEKEEKKGKRVQSEMSSTPSKKVKRKAPRDFAKVRLHRGKMIKKKLMVLSDLELFQELIEGQGWHLFLRTDLECDESVVREFYSNCEVRENVICTQVHSMSMKLDKKELGRLLGIPSHGISVYEKSEVSANVGEEDIRKILSTATNGRVQEGTRVKKQVLTPLFQLLFLFVLRNVIPRGQRRNEADLRDLVYMYNLACASPIDLPSIMIKHIRRIVNETKPHDLVYGYLITLILKKLKLSVATGHRPIKSDFFSSSTLKSCGFEVEESESSDEASSEGEETEEEEAVPQRVTPVRGSAAKATSKGKEKVVSEEGTPSQNRSETDLTEKLAVLESETKLLRETLLAERQESNKKIEDLTNLVKALIEQQKPSQP